MQDDEHLSEAQVVPKRDFRGITGTGAVALAIAALVHVLTAVQPGGTPAQVRFNMSFISELSFVQALTDYPVRWPPLYPSLVWLAARLDISEVLVNQCFFYGILVLCFLWARRFIPGVNPLYPVLMLATLESSYAMVRNITAEMLFTLLALCLLTLAVRIRQRPSFARVALATTLGAALCMSRYFGAVWLGPLLAWHCWWSEATSFVARARRTLLFSIGFLAPVVGWMLHARAKSGFLSGMDRLNRRRVGDPGIGDQLLDVTHMVKTHLVDFFSVQDWGRHRIINPPYEAEVIEYVIAGLAFAFSLGMTVAIVRAVRRRRPELPSRESQILLQFTLIYPVAVLVMWSFGNPDRIYTRFLFPSYPFLILVGTALYAWVRQRSPSELLLWCFRGFYGLILAVQCIRHAPHLWAALR